MDPRPLSSDLPYSSNFRYYSSPTRILCSTDGFHTAQETIPSHCCRLTFAPPLPPTRKVLVFYSVFLLSGPVLQEAPTACASTLCSFLSANSSWLCGWDHTGWHCIMYCFIQRSHCVLCACPVSAEDQVFVPFTVLTYNRGPVNANDIDLKVRTGIMITKWSVKTLLGGYFRHSGLSLAQSLGLEIAQDLATWLDPLHSGSLTFYFHSQLRF